MNIVDATNELFKFYAKNDCFEIGKNFHDVIIISEHPERHKAALLGALEHLEESGIVKSQKFKDKEYYILSKPLAAWDQTLIIGGETAANIAIEINEVCDQLNDERDYCDLTAIQEKDILNLVHIIRLHKQKIDINDES